MHYPFLDIYGKNALDMQKTPCEAYGLGRIGPHLDLRHVDPLWSSSGRLKP
ncbi:hypothetical protein AVEN_235839-1, partial [Araneus ventricosus]